MDKSSIIGVIFGIVAIGVGMVLKGVSPEVLVNPAAILIIILGTIASVVIAFPLNEIKRVPKLFGILFKESQKESITDLIVMFSELSQLARREGILSLERRIEEIDDPFLKNGLSLVIDGKNSEFIRDVLSEEIDAMEERHQAGALIFTQAGTYAPTLGVLGAVVGLIAALGNMNDTEALGHAISAAFVATLLGIFTGYVFWHPFANKLKRKSKNEVQVKYLMIEGILSIIEGEVPSVIEQKLSSYLPASERKRFLEERSGQKS
ncbi:flagellar motor stator protein MotA [Caldibacillus lycopersici]|uniref:Flagellar motor stator protein MotA n=1 Tax=Perspicuibacillus lycopersici TaxID=1325689 RepID=A0AAE3IQ69_9BACI|nr:flagellar motor stator protein MotA [Perspicuibacillus lycopersici]MCU9612397.1 flagellar motor stator protein MotA [Perspicuibacillus lycopersici]